MELDDSELLLSCLQEIAATDSPAEADQRQAGVASFLIRVQAWPKISLPLLEVLLAEDLDHTMTAYDALLDGHYSHDSVDLVDLGVRLRQRFSQMYDGLRAAQGVSGEPPDRFLGNLYDFNSQERLQEHVLAIKGLLAPINTIGSDKNRTLKRLGTCITHKKASGAVS